MTEQFACWKCGNKIDAEPAAAGLQIQCPHCQTQVVVPRELFGTVPAEASAPVAQAAPAAKNPVTAAILNFFFPGGGYIYLGRLWGLAILLPYVFVNIGGCLVSLDDPDAGMSAAEVLVLLGLSVGFGWHAYQMGEQDKKEAGK